MATQDPPVAVPTLPLGREVVPAIGYGVGTAWFKAEGTERETFLRDGVVAALDAGFRHLDEAEMYANEGASGKAIGDWLSRTGTPRSDLFITSKVISVDDPGVEGVCRRSLERMGLTYFDLYLVHAPFQTDGKPFAKSLAEVWKEMESLVDAGLVKAIGVSNWRICDLEEIYEGARIKPVCNQVEAHPYLQQNKLLQWCGARGILIASYSPLGSLVKDVLKEGPIDAVVNGIAERLGRSPGQVLLRWNLQTGRCVITTSSKPERMAECLGIFAFELSPADVAEISAAGAERPRRAFWTQCAQFPESPSQAEE
mmetsp:Transcript_4109/g.10169  ORF Transcript_4109/g.10169 Transcript_4109/m.10169 type:complete len:312 (+) Transcript_4109:85-1020(+)